MIHTDIGRLVPALQTRANGIIREMRQDETLRNLGVQNVTVVETIRELSTQMAYFSRGRMSVPDVRSMYRAAGLWSLSDRDTQNKITWTLDSKHMRGEAIDIAPMRAGQIWWAAPMTVWERMGEIGEAHGLAWGGRWKNQDTPHYELVT